ncbi:hypothetical protein C2E25_07370 [Geothermobacter hydrogeniphilus]|uniref:Glycosyltransferase n=1 Tax=Geothermobacter hydrogeniphilus TaxID=1969733 RepID=A0A2K2HAN8_9BACT|nr:hypothetical protein C2E25_07370 [Geothermobacter hydrogeniphilus]
MDKVVESVEKSLRQKQIHSDDKASQVLGVFAKRPLPGRVKTRLCPPCSPEQAAALYAACLDETVARLSACGRPLVLFHAGERGWFADHFPAIELRPQGEGDLGQRMARALHGLLADGFRAAALVGSDSPDLPRALVDEAFAALRTADAVAAPADDGGYVLIGCRRPCPELFRDIAWSTAEVLDSTRQAADRAGIHLCRVASWYDLDDAEAIKRLLQRSPGSRTAAYIRTHLGSLFSS